MANFIKITIGVNEANFGLDFLSARRYDDDVEKSGKNATGKELMKRSAVILTTLFLLFAGAGARPAQAQFTPEEIAARPQWEQFLETAEIIRAKEIGEGVTRPFRLYLKKGDVEWSACWKNPKGIQGGFLEGWQYEIAAYRLDKLIGLNMVPPAAERKFDGKDGALIYWVTSEHSLLKVEEEKIEIPKWAIKPMEDRKYITRAWDCLIANEDRTQQNVLYTKDWRTILIDHSRAFRSKKPFTEKLMFGRDGLKMSADGRPYLIRRLPRWFVDRIKALDAKSIKQAVGPYLTDREINAIIKRKPLLLDEIDAMIKESGEEKVIY